MTINIRKFCVSLGGTEVLSDVYLNISPGEFIGLVGPNGAGKSTLLRALAGLQPGDVGQCTVNEQNILDLSPIERARKLAYLPQSRPVYWSMIARDIVALGRFAYGSALQIDARDAKAVDDALMATGATHLEARPVGELSGGERARIHLARTLAAETPLIIADEPIAALDPAHQLSVMQMLRDKADNGNSVIAALHELPLASRFCTRIVVLDQGRIVGDADAKALPTDVIECTFGVTPMRDQSGIINALLPKVG